MSASTNDDDETMSRLFDTLEDTVREYVAKIVEKYKTIASSYKNENETQMIKSMYHELIHMGLTLCKTKRKFSNIYVFVYTMVMEESSFAFAMEEIACCKVLASRWVIFIG